MGFNGPKCLKVINVIYKLNPICTFLSNIKGTVERDFCFYLRLWEFRLGHTDVTHPLFYICTLSLLFATHCLKRAPIEVKLIASSCNTRMRLRVRSSMHACLKSLWNRQMEFSRIFLLRCRGLIHTRINWSFSKKICFRGSNTRTRNACVSETMMKSVLLRWAPSLNERNKLKGQCADLKSGCVTSLGPSLNPQSVFKKFSCYCPFKY